MPTSLQLQPAGSTTPPLLPSSYISVDIVVGFLIIGVVAFVVVGFTFFCCFREKKRKNNPHFPETAVHHLSPHKACSSELNFQSSSAATPADNVVEIPSQLWPPQAITGSEVAGSSSNYFASEASLPPLSSGLSSEFSNILFTYKKLYDATDGFSSNNLLGQGTFGCVHKGTLPDGLEVAVKQIKVGGVLGNREFLAEIEMLSQLRHQNVASLLGCCVAGGRRMLVYEFVPNHTLEYHLHGDGRPTLEWSIRLKIALGAAKGLGYLHNEYYWTRLQSELSSDHPNITHGDVKSSNILLDYNFEPKVADFGLAKIAPKVNVISSIGYSAPEYVSSGKVSYNTDSFSFGVILVELITGRKPNSSPPHADDSFITWATPLLRHAMREEKYDHVVDSKLQNRYDPEGMGGMVFCALSSIYPNEVVRPCMNQMIPTLQRGFHSSLTLQNQDQEKVKGNVVFSNLAEAVKVNKLENRDEESHMTVEATMVYSKSKDYGMNEGKY